MSNVPQQFLQAGSCRAIPLDRAVQLDGSREDRGGRRLIVFAAPRDPKVYGATVQDYYVRCSCGWWSLPFIQMPTPREIRCASCAEIEAGVENFKLFIESSRFGCHPVKEVELRDPIARSVVAGV